MFSGFSCHCSFFFSDTSTTDSYTLSLHDALPICLYEGGEKRAEFIIQEAEKIIRQAPYTDIDYVKICDASSIEDLRLIDTQAVMALAVKVGKTRLIDNHVLGEAFSI